MIEGKFIGGTCQLWLRIELPHIEALVKRMWPIIVFLCMLLAMLQQTTGEGREDGNNHPLGRWNIFQTLKGHFRIQPIFF